MKNIVITCKLFDADAQYFIDPLIESNQIDKLLLFRDKSPNIKSEIWYRKGIGIYNQQKIKFLYRFFGMLQKKKIDVFIGIYEIPHGIIALIVAILRQKQAVVDYTYKRYLFSSPKFLLINFVRLTAFFYKYNKWRKVVIPKYRWLFKKYEVTCVLLEKNK